jgi:drug/metabolite transporter (DMT)-like permease
MTMLLLATLFSAAFGLIIRWAQGRENNLWAVGALNYTVAAAFHLGRRAIEGGFDPSAPTLAIGLVAGLTYAGAYLLLFPLMRLRGVSIATAVQRLSIVIPILFAIVAWGERPDQLQTAGALLALVSLPLLTIRPAAAASGQFLERSERRRAILLLVALFVANGGCTLTIRGYQQTGIRGEESLYLGILFATAALTAGIAWWRHRSGSSRRDLVPGIALGLVNALSNLTLLAALQRLPAVVVLPFQSAVGLLLVVACARLFWRERVHRWAAYGIALTLAAVVLINIG